MAEIHCDDDDDAFGVVVQRGNWTCVECPRLSFHVGQPARPIDGEWEKKTGLEPEIEAWLRQAQHKGVARLVFWEDCSEGASVYFSDPDTAFAFKMTWA